MLRICIIGYGKMGHEVERVARERGHSIPLIVDRNNHNEINSDKFKNVDVAIEFTSPQIAKQNVQACFDAGVPVVCGTTGWNDQLSDMIEKARQGRGTLFYASNFSIGVNIFFKLNQLAASILSRVEDYKPSIIEIHHTQKLDAPSGTAISLANIINAHMPSYSGWSLLPNNITDDKIPIQAVREGAVPGTHMVTFESDQDIIRLTHEAKSRKGFALGAVLAAEFIYNRKGFYNMDNLINFD